MRLLLDTHAFLWWVTEPDRLPTSVVDSIADEFNEVFVSAVTAWEITAKFHLGKLPSAESFVGDLVLAIAREDFQEMALTVAQAARAGALPGPNRDPFDRMLISQALAGDLTLVSNEAVFDRYGVRRLW